MKKSVEQEVNEIISDCYRSECSEQELDIINERIRQRTAAGEKQLKPSFFVAHKKMFYSLASVVLVFVICLSMFLLIPNKSVEYYDDDLSENAVLSVGELNYSENLICEDFDIYNILLYTSKDNKNIYCKIKYVSTTEFPEVMYLTIIFEPNYVLDESKYTNYKLLDDNFSVNGTTVYYNEVDSETLLRKTYSKCVTANGYRYFLEADFFIIDDGAQARLGEVYSAILQCDGVNK